VDVVKTRLMTGGASAGIVGTMKAIVSEEGAATLMKGVVPRVAFLAPLAGHAPSVSCTLGPRRLRAWVGYVSIDMDMDM
jgi:hypothetical protein